MPDLVSAVTLDKSLRAQLLAQFPELSDDERALVDTLDSISDLDEQIAAILRAAGEREAHVKALGDMIAQMQERKSRLQAGADKMRAICIWAMQEAGRKKLTFPDMTVLVQQGRPGVVVIDEELLPARFVRIERRALLREIGEAIKAGETVPGTAPRNPAPFLSVRRG